MMQVISKDPKQGAQELVTLHEAQIYFRSEGSGGVEDDLIEQLISAARSYIESRISRSLIDSVVVVSIEDGYKGILPYGPIDGEITWTPSAPQVQGVVYPYVRSSINTQASYSTKAFDDPILKIAIKELAFFYYERGAFDWQYMPMKVKAAIQNFNLNAKI